MAEQGEVVFEGRMIIGATLLLVLLIRTLVIPLLSCLAMTQFLMWLGLLSHLMVVTPASRSTQRPIWEPIFVQLAISSVVESERWLPGSDPGQNLGGLSATGEVWFSWGHQTGGTYA